MKAEIIAVGTELLLGDIVNTNAQYLSQELALLGIEVYHQCTVGDNPKRLEETLETSFSRSDIVITTGGLGPTDDDLTKEIGSKFFSLDLVLDDVAYKRITDFFAKINKTMTPNNKKQAMVPVSNREVLYNKNGTAPGIIIEKDNKILIMLPGPPKEVVPMFENQVKPFLMKTQNSTFISRVLRVAGIGESALETEVKDLIDNQTNPTIATYAKDGESILRITAKADNEDKAKELIEPMAKEVKSRLGKAVYGEGETTMAEVVISLLRNKNLTIATAESCTGGLIIENLVRCAGASVVVLEGCVTYSNEAKVSRLGVKPETLESCGAVSPEVALEMANGICKTAGTDIGIGITGIAGPDGGTDKKPVGLVYMAICIKGEAKVCECRFGGNRDKIRQRACYQALDWLRTELL